MHYFVLVSSEIICVCVCAMGILLMFQKVFSHGEV